MKTDHIKHTKKEHFIAKAYLRGFSDNKKQIYGFNISENKQYPCPFSIENICQKKYLYEYRDNNGEIIKRNEIETLLGRIENNYKVYRDRLENKAFSDNKAISNFFDADEIDFWNGFASVQALRFPNILQLLTDKLLKLANGMLTKNEARNLVLYDTISYQSIMNPHVYTTYNHVFNLFKNMSISLFVDLTNSIFTHDRVLSFGKVDGSTKPNVVLLPITSKMVIMFYDQEYESEYGKNNLHYFDTKELEAYKRCTTTDAEWIYSRQPLTDRDIQILNERGKNT